MNSLRRPTGGARTEHRLASRIAIYARASSHGQYALSCADQVRRGLGVVAALGCELVAVLTDAGSPGASPVPGLRALLHLVECGAIDVIVCASLDRITRDAASLEAIMCLLSECGVGICQFEDSTR